MNEQFSLSELLTKKGTKVEFNSDNTFWIKPFYINARPPGVGKTSIVENLAHIATKKNVGSFQWRDGPLLAALKAENSWILLDELNLAPQSVLEGLNAILDHRGEVFIPELNKTFILNKQTRIFASQNPLKQGGGRKGLPQSFLNRFTKVYVRKLTTEDLLYVVEGKYSDYFNKLGSKFVSLLPSHDFASNNLFDMHNELIKIRKEHSHSEDVKKSEQISPSNAKFDLPLRMVRFSELLDKGILNMEFGYRGGPYEINLRDILFWCDLLISPHTGFSFKHVGFTENFDKFLETLYEKMKLVYSQRMRSDQDKKFIRNVFETVFKCESEQRNLKSEDVGIYWTSERIYFNDITLDRSDQPFNFQKTFKNSPLLLESQGEILKNLVECIHMSKPILLCGSTDTGKTKMIDTLCCLSNQTCHLDNIDDTVTGSFQQIDLNRHLEELVYKVEYIYLKLVQNALLDKSNSNHLITDLLKTWNTYSVLRNPKTGRKDKRGVKIKMFINQIFLSEELLNYRSSLDGLKNVAEVLLNSLKSSVNTEETDMLHNILIN
ncbi:hypothetical protein DOY81_010477 [Sarcophaga bullata]|nr:hypothetical protein DOY81_010477 [Sarcophaga bullata]